MCDWEGGACGIPPADLPDLAELRLFMCVREQAMENKHEKLAARNNLRDWIKILAPNLKTLSIWYDEIHPTKDGTKFSLNEIEFPKLETLEMGN